MSVENMVEVGTNSNNDLKKVFDNLYNGVLENKRKQKSPVCLWENCVETNVFEDVEDLYRHCKSHVEHVDTSSIAPIDRCYKCKWRGCKRSYTKLKFLCGSGGMRLRPLDF